LGDPGIDGRVILRRIFRKWNIGLWTGSMWLRMGTGGWRECGNEHSRSIICEEFFD